MDMVEELIQELKDGNWEVHKSAAIALGEIGKEAVEPLIKALGDEDAWVRWRAASVLGEIKDKRAVEPLIKALGDKDANVRSYAASALGEIKDTKAVEPLIKALGDRNEEVRESAKQSINNIYKANKEKITSKYPDLICINCFHKFKFYPVGIFSFLTKEGYYACRNCKRDEFIHPVKKVIVVLDKNIHGKDNYTHENSTLYVNWFNLKKPFDFDEISMLNADDFDIQEFIMKIRNDADESRAKNYKNIVVIIRQDLFQNLSENSKRLLKNTFNDLKFGQEQTTGANNM